MKTNEIKKAVKKITGFEYVSVRQGTGSMKGIIIVFTKGANYFKDFESKLSNVFNTRHIGFDSMEIIK